MIDLSPLLETYLEDDDDTRRIRPIQRACLDRALNPRATPRERIAAINELCDSDRHWIEWLTRSMRQEVVEILCSGKGGDAETALLPLMICPGTRMRTQDCAWALRAIVDHALANRQRRLARDALDYYIAQCGDDPEFDAIWAEDAVYRAIQADSCRRDDSFSIGLLVGWSNLQLSFDVPIRVLRERPDWFPTFLERIAAFPDVLDLLMLVAPELPWLGEAAFDAIATRRNRCHFLAKLRYGFQHKLWSTVVDTAWLEIPAPPGPLPKASVVVLDSTTRSLRLPLEDHGLNVVTFDDKDIGGELRRHLIADRVVLTRWTLHYAFGISNEACSVIGLEQIPDGDDGKRQASKNPAIQAILRAHQTHCLLARPDWFVALLNPEGDVVRIRTDADAQQ